MIAWAVAAGSLLLWALASFALARRAETCVAARPLPFPWIAIVSVAAVSIVALTFGRTPQRATACGIACIGLVVAADSDARTGYLFDAVTLPAAALSIIFAAFCGTTTQAVEGVTLLAGSFAAVVIASKGRLLGLGDVKAMFAIGATFGALESLVAIFVACICGIVHATLAGRLRRGASLRFGPHLAAGSAFVAIAGDSIVHRWMGF